MRVMRIGEMRLIVGVGVGVGKYRIGGRMMMPVIFIITVGAGVGV